MNAIRSPNRTKPKLKEETESTHKRKKYFSPITIPGTHPERRTPDNDFTTQTTSEIEDEDLQLYYSICNRFRPEIGESNAESADRHLNTETRYNKLRKQKYKQTPANKPDSRQSSTCLSTEKQGEHDLTLGHHSLSPF